MADTKTSALTDGVTLDATDDIPVSRSGANVRIRRAYILTYIQNAISILANQVSDFNTQVRTNTLNQLVAPTADLSINSHKLTNVTDPTSAQDAATKAYVDLVSQALSSDGLRAPCRAATTAVLPTVVYANGSSGVGATLTGFSVGALTAQDGVTLIAGDRLLVKNQASTLQNGIYTVTAVGGAGVFILTRATDYDQSAEIFAGTYVYITEGTVNGSGGFIEATTGTLTIGTDAITFTQFSGAGEITAGTGLAKSGNTLSLTTPVALANGGSNADLSATGGANQLVRQNSSGGAFTVSALASGDIPSLAASKITSGTLALAQGGTNADLSASGSSTNFLAQNASHVVAARDLVAGDIPNLAASKITSGTLAIAQGGTNAATAAANAAFIGPASGIAAAPSLRALVPADLPLPAAYVRFFDDFLYGVSPTVNTSGTGAAAGVSTNAPDLGGHPGQVLLETGTTNAGRGGLYSGGAVSQILLGNGTVTWETDIFLMDAVSDGTDTYQIIAGFNDLATGDGTDGVYFSYTHSANSGKFLAVTRSNGTATSTDTGQTVVTTTWYKLTIVVNAAANSVTFSINGSSVATNTTNIPSGTGRQTSPQIEINKSAGTNNRRVAVDYVYTDIALTTPR